MSEPTLTEPLLADGEEEFIGNINAEARTSSPQTETPDAENHQTIKDLKSSGLRSAFLSGDPSDSQLEYVRDSKLTEESTSSLHAKPQLEYEPTIDDDTSSHPIKTIRVRQPQKIETLSTANEPVCVKCEYCGTACETTVVHVFGLSTCLWICLLLVLCFPIAWLPLFWKDVSTKRLSYLQIMFVCMSPLSMLLG